MKKTVFVCLIIAILLILSACYYSKHELSKIVDDQLEEPLSVLRSYFDDEGEYSFSEAKEAYKTVHDVIYHDFY